MVVSPADRTLTPTAAPSTDLLRFERAVGRLRSLPSREQELRARAERAEAEVAKMRMQKAAVESEQTRWQPRYLYRWWWL